MLHFCQIAHLEISAKTSQKDLEKKSFEKVPGRVISDSSCFLTSDRHTTGASSVPEDSSLMDFFSMWSLYTPFSTVRPKMPRWYPFYNLKWTFSYTFGYLFFQFFQAISAFENGIPNTNCDKFTLGCPAGEVIDLS